MPSSYFSAPSRNLDPALFSGIGRLRSDVREGLLNTLYSGLEDDLDLHEPWNWVRAWLAGSAISYQWEANRGESDLDVLFGADYPQFLADNPEFPALSLSEVSEYVTNRLKQTLWQKTSRWNIHGRTFEATFFWNATTADDISNIHPYAAYNLTYDRWDIKPPELPEDPHGLYPQDWYDVGDRDHDRALSAKASIDKSYAMGDIYRDQGVREARSLWETIHAGRRQAFSDIGHGYGDFHNFRWQRAKETGVVDILRPVIDEDDARKKASDQVDYGTDLPPARDLITRAALRYGSPRYGQ
jgi:hypothetical protein